jgi:hypothetical protein
MVSCQTALARVPFVSFAIGGIPELVQDESQAPPFAAGEHTVSAARLARSLSDATAASGGPYASPLVALEAVRAEAILALVRGT